MILVQVMIVRELLVRIRLGLPRMIRAKNTSTLKMVISILPWSLFFRCLWQERAIQDVTQDQAGSAFAGYKASRRADTPLLYFSRCTDLSCAPSAMKPWCMGPAEY